MNKNVLLLTGLFALGQAGTMSASRLWFLNLTNSPQSFKYQKEQPGVDNWKLYYFHNIPAKSKSEGHDIARREIKFPAQKQVKDPITGKMLTLYDKHGRKGNWTVIMRKNGTIQFIDAGIYDSDRVKKIIKEDLGSGDPKKLIGNW